MLETITVYYNACLEAENKQLPLPRIPDYIGECFLLLATRIANKGNFIGYPYREEMISDAVLNCVMQIRSFNPMKGNNPFAYFTRVILNAYMRRIKAEKRDYYLKIKNRERMHMQEELMYGTPQPKRSPGHEIVDEYVRAYEKSAADKKEKATQDKLAKSKPAVSNSLSKFTE